MGKRRFRSGNRAKHDATVRSLLCFRFSRTLIRHLSGYTPVSGYGDVAAPDFGFNISRHIQINMNHGKHLEMMRPAFEVKFIGPRLVVVFSRDELADTWHAAEAHVHVHQTSLSV
jgi:hypothetical protein